MKTFIIYHNNCTDGLGAQYAAWKKYGERATYIPANYGKPFPPQVTLDKNSEVYIIDFSYTKEILDDVNSKVGKLMVIDHHKTAKEALEGVEYAVFDMDKSGAVLAWEYFHNSPPPELLQYIQDRDLWKWKLENTKHMLNALSIHGNDVKTWDEFQNDMSRRLNQGLSISLYQDKQVKFSSSEYNVCFTKYQDFKIALVNCTTQISEIGSTICEKYDVDFCMGYFIDKSGTVNLSLRSVGDFDVSTIAKQLGGGGHKNASGARISISFLTELYANQIL